MTNQTGYRPTDSLEDDNTLCPIPDTKEPIPPTIFVYLEQGCNHVWYSLICRNPPSEDAAKLCAEKDYPVEVTYRRTDLNGSISYDTYICCDREDLLQALNWRGSCGFIPCQVWDFDIDKEIDPMLHKLFTKFFKIGRMTHASVYAVTPSVFEGAD